MYYINPCNKSSFIHSPTISIQKTQGLENHIISCCTTELQWLQSSRSENCWWSLYGNRTPLLTRQFEDCRTPKRSPGHVTEWTRGWRTQPVWCTCRDGVFCMTSGIRLRKSPSTWTLQQYRLQEITNAVMSRWTFRFRDWRLL